MIVSPHPCTALVTGAAHRIGRAITLALAEAGYCIAVHYARSAHGAEALVAEILARGGLAQAFHCDLTDVRAVERLIPAATAALGPVTVLINNAAVFEADTITTISPESWARHQDVNLRAPVLLAQSFAEHLPSDRAGVIINLIDQRVWRPTPYFFSYAVSKAALFSATQMLAQALAPRIRVNAIGPGPVLQSVHQSPEQFAAQAAAVPLGRASSPDEIAAAVRFLIDAPSITGQMIALDGGQHLAWCTPDVEGVEG